MIAAATDDRQSRTDRRRRPRPQVVEVRVVVEVQMPQWMHPGGALGNSMQAGTVSTVLPPRVEVSQRPPNADPLRGESQEGKSVPEQDVNGSAFYITSSESIAPDEVVLSETTTAPEPVETEEQTGGNLLDFYRSDVKAKRARSAGHAAIAEHESAMRAFDTFFQRLHRFPEPPVDPRSKNLRFTTPKHYLEAPEALSAFARHLIFVEGLSPSTVCKRLTNLGVLKRPMKLDLEKPTPEEVKRLHSERMRDMAMWPDDGAVILIDRRIPSFAEIDAMARVVSIAGYPYGEHAPYFWRGWIRFLAYIGPRARDVVSVIPRKAGLLKEHVIFDTLCPSPDVNNALGYELHSAYGWLWYVIGKDQHSDCRKILFPMPPWMRDWIRFFVELSPCERVFPSVMTRKIGFLSQTQMTREWNAMAKKAGVDLRLVPSEGTGDRIALRKFASNWWSIATSNSPKYSALADKMENYVLHHVPKSTSKKHYISDQAKLLPVMLELMNSWPVPAADAPHVSLLPE